MKEKIANLVNRFRGHLDMILVGTLGAVLGVLGYLRISESNSPVPEPLDPTRTDIDLKVSTRAPTAEDPSGIPYLVIQQFADGAKDETLGRDDLENSVFARLRQINPFDAKAVRDSEELEEQIIEHVIAARGFMNEGSLTDALAEIESALAINADHKTATPLKGKIEDLILAAEQRKEAAEQSEPGDTAPAGGSESGGN